MKDPLKVYDEIIKIANESTKWELVEFTEYGGEKVIGLYDTKNEAIQKAKNEIWASGSFAKNSFTYSSRFDHWTNDLTGMEEGGFTIRKVVS